MLASVKGRHFPEPVDACVNAGRAATPVGQFVLILLNFTSPHAAPPCAGSVHAAKRSDASEIDVPFNNPCAAVNSISFGSAHVCFMGRTCGEPNEIKKNTHPKKLPLFFVRST